MSTLKGTVNGLISEKDLVSLKGRQRKDVLSILLLLKQQSLKPSESDKWVFI